MALSSALHRALGEPQRLELYGGTTTFHIVGTVRDEFDRSAQDIYAAPGAIARIMDAVSRHGDRYSKPQVSAQVRFDGGDRATVTAATANIAHQLTRIDAANYRDDIAHSWTTRRATDRSWSDYYQRAPYIAGWIPLWLLPAVSSTALIITGQAYRRQVRDQLWALGIPYSTSTLIQAGTLIIGALITISTAVLTGDAVGRFLRPALNSYANQPLSPEILPITVLIVSAISALIPILIATVIALSQQLLASALKRIANSTMTKTMRTLMRSIRRVALIIGATWLAYTGFVSRPHNASGLSLWVMIWCTVGAVAGAFLLISYQDHHGRLPVPILLGIRRTTRYATSTLLTMIAVMICLSLPLASAITTATNDFHANALRVAHIGQNQVALGREQIYSGGVNQRLRRDFEAATQLSNPIAMRYVLIDPTDIMQGLPFAMDTAHDIERLIGHPLTPAQIQHFSAGGILVFAEKDGLTLAEGSVVEFKEAQNSNTPAKVPVSIIRNTPKEYVVQGMGFISAERARQAGWPMDVPYWVYDQASPAQITAALRAPKEQNFDDSYITVHKAPEKITVPPTLTWAAVGSGLVFLVLTCAVAIFHTRSLRDYRTSLDAIGISPAVLVGTVITVITMTIVIPAVMGLGIAILGNELAWGLLLDSSRGAHIPYDWVRSAMAATGVVILVGTTSGLVQWRRR
ncbi:hypothetical protein [Austwickia sp. TVS 96-490-7B]|uniref:hypothetical protein n=1 Tax=Austwickia sp. TVS 96-490-7B TaxID=2830843 RepID=UPI001C59E473|nr:hypothetical protein [Austwickia sp. TVS 96-490-7B]